jgi:translation initiation factor IF-3|tara:strand:+ start:581 stop:1147 length:567 start_codon:yes stop_codon:yes gene_type:complete
LKKQFFKKQNKEPFRINSRITALEVRIVSDNVKLGIYKTNSAIEIAKQKGLDLVEISSSAIPPICKIIDYSKFKYDQKKKEKSIKSKSNKVILKEIRFGPNTNDHDLNFKLNNAIKFLKNGLKLKAYVQFKGRSIVFKERGELILLKFAQSLKKYGKLDQLPKLDGRRMVLTLSSLYSKKSKKVENKN